MKNKTIIKSFDKAVAGAKKAADVIGATLGPSGSNVLIQDEFSNLRPTKDGVSVAKSLAFSDPEEQVGLQILIQACNNAVNKSGDGTTNTSILFSSILEESRKLITLGANPLKLRKEIEQAATEAINSIYEHSIPAQTLEALQHVATLSANNNFAIGSVVGEAVHQMQQGTILIERQLGTPEIAFEHTPAYAHHGRIAADLFMRGQRIIHLTEPQFWLFPGALDNLADMKKKNFVSRVLEALMQSGKPSVILCDSCAGDALELFAKAAKTHEIFVYVYDPADRVELRKDLASVVNAVLPDLTQHPFAIWEPHWLGKAAAATLKNNQIVIEHYNPELIHERADQIEGDDHMANKRRTALLKGIGTLVIHGRSEAEQQELADLVEDALLASRAALKSGVVAGGGTLMLRASRLIDQSTDGGKVVAKALSAPFRVLMVNAGLVPEVVANEILSEDYPFGFDLVSGEACNLLQNNIIEPALVPASALESAVAFSALLTGSAAMILNEKESK